MNNYHFHFNGMLKKVYSSCCCCCVVCTVCHSLHIYRWRNMININDKAKVQCLHDICVLQCHNICMCCTVPQEYSCSVYLPCMSSLYQTYLVSLSIIWIVSITLLLCIISIVRHIYHVVAASARTKQMESCCEGPVQSTAWNKEGRIVPVVNYLKEDREGL